MKALRRCVSYPPTREFNGLVAPNKKTEGKPNSHRQRSGITAKTCTEGLEGSVVKTLAFDTVISYTISGLM